MDYKSITEVNELVKSILESEPLLNDICGTTLVYDNNGAMVYYSIKNDRILKNFSIKNDYQYIFFFKR